MPTIEMVRTRHDKAATTTCSVATIKNTQQSTSSGLMKKETKRQRRIFTETARGMTIMSMTVMATGMAVTGMAMMAHIPRL
eukprot:10830524-Ditylum_brightwellii.AAC.1